MDRFNAMADRESLLQECLQVLSDIQLTTSVWHRLGVRVSQNGARLSVKEALTRNGVTVDRLKALADHHLGEALRPLLSLDASVLAEAAIECQYDPFLRIQEREVGITRSHLQTFDKY